MPGGMKGTTMLFKKILAVAILALFTAGVFADDEPAQDEENRGARVVTGPENGDLDGDGNRNITDAVRMLNYLFSGGPPPVPAVCEVFESGSSDKDPVFSVPTEVQNGDVDGNGSMNITDVIRFMEWLFAAGDEPVSLGCDWLFSQ